uniref:Diphthine--ammonia ligase n=1 Tax=Leptocylindrus danicus TaxID=163516 RepID=A0A7S2KIS1_9STRA|mmetsp:Transcript_23262/g.34923  ORF Transcript_23262/g.34923 Transcript_23262/m.34923 type:complete len:293 (+) Transcript_23262:114-992(+)
MRSPIDSLSQSESSPPEIAAVSWTGGKDCNLALLHAQRDPNLSVQYLLTFRPENKPFRAHPLPFMDAQADALGLKLIHVVIPEGTTDYMQAYVDGLVRVRNDYGISVIVTGDMDLVGTNPRNWIVRCCEIVCESSDYTTSDTNTDANNNAASKDKGGHMRAYLPLWGKNRIETLEIMLDEGLEIIFTCVKSPFFDASWIRRKLDRNAIDQMKEIMEKELTEDEINRGIKPLDLCGERGEYHTMCVDGPMYKKRVDVSSIISSTGEPLREDFNTNWKGNIHNADTIWMIPCTK